MSFRYLHTENDLSRCNWTYEAFLVYYEYFVVLTVVFRSSWTEFQLRTKSAYLIARGIPNRSRPDSVDNSQLSSLGFAQTPKMLTPFHEQIVASTATTPWSKDSIMNAGSNPTTSPSLELNIT